MGFKKDGVVVVEGPMRYDHSSETVVDSFIEETKRIGGVSESTVSYLIMSEVAHGGLQVMSGKNSNRVTCDTNGGVDEHFLDTYDIQLIAGRNFLPDNQADQNSILVSQTVVNELGIASPQEAIGKRIILPDQQKEDVEIIGVISDYEFKPFYNEQYDRRGIALTYKNFLVDKFRPSKFSIALDIGSLESEIRSIERLYKEMFPGEVFTWYLMNDRIAQQYRVETTAKNQIMFFTILAIGIACIGLLGMISNRVVERTKEIGIRKVLGAQIYQIGHILLNTTIKQIVIATIIGLPVAYYLTQRYLQKFSLRINLQWWYYAAPVCLLVIIMFSTIAFVVSKAARANPVESLRYDN